MKFSFIEFIDEPPGWFKFLLWLYPVFWMLSLYPIFFLLKEQNDETRRLGLFGWFVLPLLFIFCCSTWFRKQILYMVPVWIGVFWFGMGLTQGALNATISKCFSAVIDSSRIK
ncbi:MAG: hypothetical protein JSS83_10195 [Cyanobacteria bacterium SZAS LIN-3]|nr:hypothetical protein [Cyanobacteria bacterium SZAS LIN-3]MBS2009242.1 hypothetical protein [Cyanobacteria bacterium SZAS TMP-1]